MSMSATAQFLQLYAEGRRDFSRWNLAGADLQRAQLKGINLAWAALQQAVLAKANLEEANLRDAHLHEANFDPATLRSVDLRYADLTQAILTGANLTDALLERADMRDIRFGEVDLLMANLRRVDAQHTEEELTGTPAQAGLGVGDWSARMEWLISPLPIQWRNRFIRLALQQPPISVSATVERGIPLTLYFGYRSVRLRPQKTQTFLWGERRQSKTDPAGASRV